MIKNIIFDIGGVLTEAHFKDKIESFDWSDDVKKRVFDATFNNPVWTELDKGLLSEEEIVNRMVIKDTGIKKEIHQYMSNISGCIIKGAYTDEWLSDLRDRGFRLLYLSNWSVKAMRELWKELDFFRYMDGGILSYRDRVIKPNREIYELLIERYKLIPKESVFIDDMPENIQAAVDVGIHGIIFKSYEDARARLEELIMSEEN